MEQELGDALWRVALSGFPIVFFAVWIWLRNREDSRREAERAHDRMQAAMDRDMLASIDLGTSRLKAPGRACSRCGAPEQHGRCEYCGSV